LTKNRASSKQSAPRLLSNQFGCVELRHFDFICLRSGHERFHLWNSYRSNQRSHPGRGGDGNQPLDVRGQNDEDRHLRRLQLPRPRSWRLQRCSTDGGFQSQTQANLRLDANQNAHVSFNLQPGSIEQNMTVEARTALVDTRESQIGSTVDSKRIQDLPLNGRNAYDLVPIGPGVTNYIPDIPTGSRAGTQLTINGVSRGTAFYLDGTFNNDVQLGGNLLPNPDALHEFRVLTSNFDSEFGRLAGGVVSVSHAPAATNTMPSRMTTFATVSLMQRTGFSIRLRHCARTSSGEMPAGRCQ
jgi:hypothetical protein